MGDPAELAAEFYLCETMNIVSSDAMERQVRALGLTSLLNELLAVVLDLHSAIISCSFVGKRSYYGRIQEIYVGCLRPVLDKLLSYDQPGAEANGNLRGRLVSLHARRRFCVATTRELKASLAALKNLLHELDRINGRVGWLKTSLASLDAVQPLVGRDRLLQEMTSIIRGEYFWGNTGLSHPSYVPPRLMQQLCTKSTTATWVDPSDNEALPPPLVVLTLVGGLGVGKTTLAKVLYDVDAFDVKCWTHVSQIFDPMQILTALWKSCYLEDQADESLDALAEGVRHALFGKRYLLVLRRQCLAFHPAIFHRASRPGCQLISTVADHNEDGWSTAL